MITKQELINKIKNDPLSTQFVRFILDDLCPSEIPIQRDENSRALSLLKCVFHSQGKAAGELLDNISKRSIDEGAVWISNDLFFVSIAIASIRFNLHRDFIRSVAELRIKLSAGGSHKGIAQAVLGAATGKPDFTESAAIFSIVFSSYIEKFSVSNRDISQAYDSFQSYDWESKEHSVVSHALALRGWHEIVTSLDLFGDRSHISNLYRFARNFPKRITRFSRLVAWIIVCVMALLIVFQTEISTQVGIELSKLHAVFSGGLGISSLWAVLSLIPKVQKGITQSILWVFGYPNAENEEEIKKSRISAGRIERAR